MNRYNYIEDADKVNVVRVGQKWVDNGSSSKRIVKVSGVINDMVYVEITKGILCCTMRDFLSRFKRVRYEAKK